MDCPRCNGPVKRIAWPNPDGRGIAETFDKCADCGWQSNMAYGSFVRPDVDEVVSVLDEEDDE